jgi:3-oxoacyl-[acyl-carrier protein] reductase
MTGERFAGKNAVVTGAARGIGLAIAQRLAQEGAGVSLWDLDGQRLAESVAGFRAEAKVHGQSVDVTDETKVRAAAEATEAVFGPVDILVNNAGIAGSSLKTWDYTIEEWNRVVALDLGAVFLCCKTLVTGMMDRGYGRIVNVASIAGKEGNPNASAYSAAKAGVIGLTKSLGKETAGTGVIVNCITPAAVRTEIFDQISEEHIQYMLERIPLGRFGKVEEIAALVAWLASEDCSFSTGAVFDISGGRATY